MVAIVIAGSLPCSLQRYVFASVGCGFKMFDVHGHESKLEETALDPMISSTSLLTTRGPTWPPKASCLSQLCPSATTHLSPLP